MGSESPSPFLSIRDQPIYFQEDWSIGIGGGLWSTGLALAHYLKTEHAAKQARFDHLEVLELGSGNGLLSVCLAAWGSVQSLVVTDLDDEHLQLIRQTLQANQHILRNKNVQVVKHKWGDFEKLEDEAWAKIDFDLIIGSDVAYREELYDPLIASLQYFVKTKTIVLLGVTMADTKAVFFDLLEKGGFRYEKMADHLMPENFRGTTFGIFVIQNKA
jgi:predicted nicotinamide N-methyase